ncbi:MAG: hypothetical protein ABFS34_02030 [Gemmatimonadota bacterium]
MELLRDDQVPNARVERRESARSHLFFGVLLTALGLGAAALPVFVQEARSFFALAPLVVIAASLLLVGRVGIGSFAASRDSRAWLVRRAGDRTYLRFRSFHNRRFDPGTPTVAAFAAQELAWARPLVRTLQEPGAEGGWTSTLRVKHVEIGLAAGPAPRELSEAIVAESKRRDSRGARTNHQPLSVSPAGTLLLETARPAAVAALLEDIVEVREEVVVDAHDFERMSAGQKSTHARELARSGRTISAVAAKREASGGSLADARDSIGRDPA